MTNNPKQETLITSMLWYNLHFEYNNEIIILFDGDVKIDVSGWTTKDLESWIC